MDEKDKSPRVTGFLVGALVAVMAFQLIYTLKNLHLTLQVAMPVLRDIRHELLSAAAGAKDD